MWYRLTLKHDRMGGKIQELIIEKEMIGLFGCVGGLISFLCNQRDIHTKGQMNKYLKQNIQSSLPPPSGFPIWPPQHQRRPGGGILNPSATNPPPPLSHLHTRKVH